ncbi:MAG: bacterial transcriptional activator domain-containing protein [Caldilineaceae bacterium]
MARWEQALSLYRADFLAGFSVRACPAFDEWQFFQSERLRRELVNILQKLIVGYSRQQEWAAAIKAGQRCLSLDPLDEQVHRTLIQLYAHAGQPTAALRQYQECERILTNELQVTPDEETQALYQAIKARKLPPSVALPGAINPPSILVAQPRNLPLPSAPTHRQAPPFHNLPAQLTPLLGREQERARLQAMLRRPEVRLINNAIGSLNPWRAIGRSDIKPCGARWPGVTSCWTALSSSYFVGCPFL